jgi:hypothetical protein
MSALEAVPIFHILYGQLLNFLSPLHLALLQQVLEVRLQTNKSYQVAKDSYAKLKCLCQMSPLALVVLVLRCDIKFKAFIKA